MDMNDYADGRNMKTEITQHVGWKTDEDSGWQHYAMRVRLTAQKPARSITVDWKQGAAHEAKCPDAGTVLDSLVGDAQAFADSADVEDFAANFGYSMDTLRERRKVEKTFKACESMFDRMRSFLGDDFEFVMGEVDRL